MFEDATILRHIERLPHARASFKQLVREFGARGDARPQLEAALKRLAQRGALIEFRPGHFVSAARTKEFVTGRLHRHRDGYGFVIPDRRPEGVEGDIFVSSAAADKAMHGDRVLARITRVDRTGRAEGEIVQILRRAHPTVVGEFRVRRNGCFVIPHDGRLREWIKIPRGLEIPERRPAADRMAVQEVQVRSAADLDGMIVDVELLEYPANGEPAVGRVIEVLGYPEDFGVDVEIIIRKHHLPHRFPPEVLEQAQTFPTGVRAHELAGRVDFRGMDIVTIDGETARDFDDAVWVDRLPNGNYALHVHIADVSHYVKPGTPIDIEAYRRGTSVYFPDRAVPMLPLELSAELCSLKPHADRLVLSVLLEIDHRGDVISQEFVKGVIRSAARLTYTEVHAALEGEPAARERWAHLLERFERMRELALILNRKRARRGSIDFDLPEPLIEFDEWGEMTGVTRAPRNVAHRLIEEFMLAANEAVASHLEANGVPSLYRIHEPPDPHKVMEFEEIAAHFGHSLGLGALPVKRFPVVDRKRDGRKIRRDLVLADERLKVSSRHYQRLVEKIQGKPEERILSYLMLRSLKQARYSPENSGHFALATDTYTHFTSPIRRYPDLVVHRLLSALLQGTEPPPMDLPAIATQASETERRAAEAERELVEWKKAKFMAERLGDEFDALIISTSRFGLFVELTELFVEGLIPLDSLPGERYRYLENARQIVGERTRRRFAIGDRIRVRLDRVDAVERRLYFSLAEPESAKKRRGLGGHAHL